MRSAYVIKNGAEPEWTNLARSKFNKDGTFIETLDYIFISDNWSVNSVKNLPTKASMAGVESFPGKTEPSDHVMITAQLKLN